MDSVRLGLAASAACLLYILKTSVSTGWISVSGYISCGVAFFGLATYLKAEKEAQAMDQDYLRDQDPRVGSSIC
jgi:hypothetical protein